VNARLQLIALPGIPLVEPGEDLAKVVIEACARAELTLVDGDVLIVAQKIVSKAEGRYVRLIDVEPSPAALDLAAATGKDPRIAELILRESREVVRQRPGVIVVEHRLGYVHANAGIDRSNIVSDDDNDPRVLLLPREPDASARGLRDALRQRCGAEVAVIVNDTAGRAWRRGVIGFAIGCAGIEPVKDMVGHSDLFGYRLERTHVAVADELAVAGSLLMGQANEGLPVVLARGMRFTASDVGSHSLIRPKTEDMFR
jgi:coenzyme F420-0:L-glutamate ligase/coenzyme F420-1:gamma-L-glutamate ligase